MAQTVLLISQDESFTRTLESWLASAGYEVLVTWHAHAALATAEVKQPDLVMVEHEPPDIDGIRITKRMRADRQLYSIPIVILSRNPTVEEIENSLDSGADSFVSTPFNRRVLLAQIQAIFRRTSPTAREGNTKL